MVNYYIQQSEGDEDMLIHYNPNNNNSNQCNENALANNSNSPKKPISNNDDCIESVSKVSHEKYQLSTVNENDEINSMGSSFQSCKSFLVIKKVNDTNKLHIEIKIGDMKKIIPISPNSSFIKLMVNDFITQANQQYRKFFLW